MLAAPPLECASTRETRGQEQGHWTNVQAGGPQELELVWKPRPPGVCPDLLEGLSGWEEGLGAPQGGIGVGRGLSQVGTPGQVLPGGT